MKSHRNRYAWALVCPSLLLAGWLAGGLATARPIARSQEGFPDLVTALEKTKGCLGVETARSSSGKNVIFAWFEDKKAANRWYWSDIHQQTMEKFFADYERGKPFQGVPDNVGPIMAVASITPDATNPEKPFSQIAVELYTPLKECINVGGSFSPEAMVVPKRKVVIDDEGK